MSVDLPAPLPPTKPMTSPGQRSTVTPSTAWTPPNATRMSRISTSGAPERSTTVATAVDAASSTHVRRGLRIDGVEADGATRTMPTTTSWVGELTSRSTCLDERLHHHGAEDGARNRTDAPGERRAADDRGRNDVELDQTPRSVTAAFEPGGLDRGTDRRGCP